MKRGFYLSIENKILIPFVCISLITVVCFCGIFYHVEYEIKIGTEIGHARALAGYITADINSGLYGEQPEQLLKKYEQIYPGDSLFVYDREGELMFGRRAPGEEEIVLEDTDGNRLGWRIVYSLDSRTLHESFLEEQRYMILAAVAMLIIIVQASVLIAYHISTPLRELGEICTKVSRTPDCTEDLDNQYIRRRDELGQFAEAFQSMLDSQRRHTRQLSRVKALNESIVENLPLGVVVYDGAGEMVFRNSRAGAMLALGERDSEGQDLQGLLQDMVRRNDVLPAPARLMGTGGKVRDYEFGSWKLDSPDTTQWDTLCTIDDVTYKKYMEEKAGQDQKLAYVGQLAASVAHEARNPLAGIRAGLQVVGRKVSEDRDRMLCREMVREVDRVNLLIENLLNLARKRESEKTTVNLSRLCDELLMLYFKVAENKGITLTVEMAGELWLFADEQELRQILINLINNSIKALPGGGNVSICGRPTPDGVQVTIADNGVGMERGVLKRIIRGEGGGLGLSIVRRLLRQNGGTLRLESVPNGGTTVELQFRGTGGEV